MAGNDGGEFGDTTFTKVFVGGLAWETQRETMRLYFEQFGDILEAVVITDKNTGRSKGYGFVTFREAESARRACVDSSPIIDGRRANCNLASLGARRPRSSTPQPGNRLRIMPSFPLHTGAPAAYASGGLSFAQHAHYTYQQGYPYHVYGFSPYPADYSYPQNYYSPYAATQYPQIYPGQGMISTPAVYPLYTYNQANAGGGYPHAQPMLHYPTAGNAISSLPQQYGGIISTPAAATGVTLSLPPNAVQQYAVQLATSQPYHAGGADLSA
ncbi:uncharacterized protein LOC131072954 isoform X1 [Cryptomeria japonica]|uniref:uncharacterized protein LOC131072954 isoform X1 n=1 Tax=Cryptomeria japonica TaxID=3369 RepID=UPI0027DAAAD7|nr:uncharacterized protein LOC131072954 isoform X1 [Cryptomeria japonica]XP_057865251.2 uncharacterized protein LOC131072954 isoform X1 [Cryptomeria japonica]